jgi:hypothetical protein
MLTTVAMPLLLTAGAIYFVIWSDSDRSRARALRELTGNQTDRSRSD